jgi:hypothetical protein
VAFLYAVIMAGHMTSADGNLMFWQAMSLALNHSIHFAWPVPTPAGNFWNSQYGLGLSLLYVPGIVIVHWLDPSLVQHAIPPTSPNTWKLFALVGAPVEIVVTAVGALMVAGCLRQLGSGHRLAIAGLLVYGICSPAIVYSKLDFAQPLEALCYLLALWAVLKSRTDARPRWAVLAGCVLFYAILTRPVEGALLFPALLLLDRRRGAVGVLIGGLLLGVAVTLLVNFVRSGNPLHSYHGDVAFSTPLLVGLAGSLLSPARGLLWSLPAIFLAPVGGWYLWRSSRRFEALAIVYLCIALLIVVSLWFAWWGGYDWGLRLFLPAMPLVVILGMLGVSRLRPAVGWLVGGVIAAAGLAWALPGSIENGFFYEAFANGTVASWKLDAYPPVGAWQFLRGWLGSGPIGATPSADVLWLSLSRPDHLGLLIPMGVLSLLAIGCLLEGVRRAWITGPAGSGGHIVPG